MSGLIEQRFGAGLCGLGVLSDAVLPLVLGLGVFDRLGQFSGYFRHRAALEQGFSLSALVFQCLGDFCKILGGAAELSSFLRDAAGAAGDFDIEAGELGGQLFDVLDVYKRQLLESADKHVKSNQLDKAGAALERALRIEPRNAGIWHDLAQIRLHQGQYQQAESLASKSINLAGGNRALQSRNWKLIGSARKATGNAAGAEEAEAHASQLSH